MEQIMFNSNPLLLTIFTFFPIFFIFKLLKKTTKSKNSNLPPSPTKLPFIGNLHQIGNLPYKSLYNLSLKHGPIMFVKLGTTQYLVLSSSNALEEITKDHDIAFSNRPTITCLNHLKGNGQDMVYHPYGDHWKKLRNFSNLHLLSKHVVVSKFQTMRDEEISSMLETVKGGEEINVTDMFKTAVRNIFHRSYTGSNQMEENNNRKEFLDWDGKFKKLMGYFCVADLFSSFGWIDRFTGRQTRY